MMFYYVIAVTYYYVAIFPGQNSGVYDMLIFGTFQLIIHTLMTDE